MSTAYKGRHTGGVTRGTPAADKTRTTGHGLSHTLRRPLAAAAAILAIAGISAASSSQATTNGSGPKYTPSPMAMAQAAQLSRNQDDTDVALAAARRSEVIRSSTLTHLQQVAADALAQARAQAAARTAQALVAARAQAAEVVARAQQRQALLARAQSDPKSMARLLAGDRGWGDGEFSCLDSLWTKESGWSWSANNGSSGAYGIAQSLPGNKMASMGSDWVTNPVTQIKWGLQYIADSYGTPCSAWAHSQAMNWY